MKQVKEFSLDLNGHSRTLDHYWELCVGSCHAATALRADWQEQMTRCHRELGFRYVRFHGLFNDDMNVVQQPVPVPGVPLRLCFTYIDVIFDFLLSINMKPFVELGFMPEALASGKKTLFHYKANTTPPKDYDQWAWFIGEFTKHLIDRYGRDEVRSWFFEVWNEPNLGGKDSPAAFWSADKEEYFKLYEVTARSLKAQDSCLKVGGPATSNNAWIIDMIEFCRKSGAPLDFITTHHYPTDSIVGYGVEDSDTFANPLEKMNDPQERAQIMGSPEKMMAFFQEMSIYQSQIWKYVERGQLAEFAKRARAEAGELPLYYTEWGSLAGIESDGPFGASFVAKTILDNTGLVQGYSFWAFSDIVEEQGQQAAAFHGGFGLLTQHGIPKAPYRAFQLLRQLGNKLYPAMNGGTVDLYPVYKDQTRVLHLLAVNHNSLLHEIEDETLRIALPEDLMIRHADIQRVDDDHANALGAWRAFGTPEYLNPAQKAMLLAASELRREPLDAGERVIELTVPAQGIALISLYLQ
jgi:xylan 1,4-beta-xylosidase